MEIDRLGIDDTISAMGVRQRDGNRRATTVNYFIFLFAPVVRTLRTRSRRLFPFHYHFTEDDCRNNSHDTTFYLSNAKRILNVAFLALEMVT